MSPLSVRRYRAERLLRNEFKGLRGAVLATVRARLRASHVSLDPGDLEDCYAQAWHGLYMAMIEGRREISNPAGWLALVTYRRAIDEYRARTRACQRCERAGDDGWRGRDVVDELDDRERLRQLMEGLRARLAPRERQAAALCYLQGLSRADAAARMGISDKRMRKLMDGSRSGTPGVAAKVGQLLETIRAGSFCAEQSSLMRGLAFGILDPRGERYALALAHQRECPACRAYVLSLRGLASVLPPPPLPLVFGAGVAASAGTTAAGTGAGGGASAGAASGVAGAGGAAGGGWLLAGGGLGAKLAVGCLLAAGVGASCIALTVGQRPPERAAHHRRVAHVLAATVPARDEAAAQAPPVAAAAAPARSALTPRAYAAAQPRTAAAAFTSPAGMAPALAPVAAASREFSLEQPVSAGAASTKRSRARAAHAPAGARRAAKPSGEASGTADRASGAGAPGTGSPGAGSSGTGSSGTDSSGTDSSGTGSSGAGSSAAGSGTSSAAGSGSSTPAPPASSQGGSSAAPSRPSPAEREFGIG